MAAKKLDRPTLHWAMRRLFALGYPEQAAQLAADFNDQAKRLEKAKAPK